MNKNKRNDQKKKKKNQKTKNNHYKKKDDGVKGRGHIKVGVVLTLTYKVTNWHK